MTPDQTQDILALIAALWPRQHITETTRDAWAVALVPHRLHQTAKQAVIDHSRSENGEWPPSVATITAAMRAQQRNIRPYDQIIATINANHAHANQDRENNQRRITRCANKVGTIVWMETLDAARQQLVDEYDHTHIPTQLVAKRACELIEWEAS